MIENKKTKSQIIYEWLMAEIKCQNICIGDQLPTESIIMDKFSVHRTTVRTALGKLEKADMIVRKRGKGTFLIADTPPQFVRCFSQVDAANHDNVEGATVEFNTIEKKFIEAPENIGMVLGAVKSKILMFSRVISVSGEPALIETTYLSENLSSLFVDLDTNRPYYPLIEKYGSDVLSHVKISFSAVIPTKDQQKLLHIDKNTPCVAIQSHLFNDAGDIIEVLESIYRGDKYLFTTESPWHKATQIKTFSQ